MRTRSLFRINITPLNGQSVAVACTLKRTADTGVLLAKYAAGATGGSIPLFSNASLWQSIVAYRMFLSRRGGRV